MRHRAQRCIVPLHGRAVQNRLSKSHTNCHQCRRARLFSALTGGCTQVLNQYSMLCAACWVGLTTSSQTRAVVWSVVALLLVPQAPGSDCRDMHTRRTVLCCFGVCAAHGFLRLVVKSCGEWSHCPCQWRDYSFSYLALLLLLSRYAAFLNMHLYASAASWASMCQLCQHRRDGL